MKLLMGVIAVLLAVIAGGIVFLITQDDDPAPAARPVADGTPTGEETPAGEEPPTPLDEPTIEPTTTPGLGQILYGPVRTDEPNLELALESLTTGESNVLIGFAVTHRIDESIECNSYLISSREMAKAYLVDDASNKKYEVVVDANGQALVSDSLEARPCHDGETYGFTIQFTAPAAGSTVSVVLPFAQPISGVVLE